MRKRRLLWIVMERFDRLVLVAPGRISHPLGEHLAEWARPAQMEEA